jgi:hypothetical protein
MPLNLETFGSLRPFLYHSTARSNLESIKDEHALYSAYFLTPKACSERRQSPVRISRGKYKIEVRDQQSLRSGHVELLGGWSWQKLLAAINERVFFWPGKGDGPIDYGCRQIQAYSDQIVLRVKLFDLLAANAGRPPYFCKFNCGGPRTVGGRKSPRGPETFLLACRWSDIPSKVAEVSLVKKVLLPETTELWDALRGGKQLFQE